MRKILFTSIILACVSLNAQISYNIGQTVDDFTGTDTKGNIHNLYEVTASGKYIFLDFFFTTCPPCIATQKYFNELHDKYGCNNGDIYTLSITGYPGDTNERVDLFEQNYGGEFEHSPAISIDGNGVAITNQFGVNLFPTYALIGPDNKVIQNDIYPISNVGTFENAFPADSDITPMDCEDAMAATDLNANSVSIFPTVSDGKFSVALGKSNSGEIVVYNLQGQEVHKSNFKGQQTIGVNLNLGSGIYILKVQTTDKKGAIKKIIIK